LDLSRRLLSWAIEGFWLAAVVLVPLTFAPPGWFAQFDAPKMALLRVLSAGLIGLWLVDLAIALATAGSPSMTGAWARLRAWLSAEPLRYVVVGAGALLALTALSAAVSPFGALGWRGAEIGRDGTSLLSVGSAFAIFFVIACKLRTLEQAWRLVMAIAGMAVVASLFAVAQALGLDPFTVLDHARESRPVGSFGDPTYLGSALVIGLPLVFAVGLRLGQRMPAWVAVPATGMAGGLVLAALVLTDAGAAWLGSAVTLVAFGVVAWRSLPTERRQRALAMLGATAVVALAVVAAASAQPDREAGANTAGYITDAADAGVGGLTSIWGTSLSLAWERPWFAFGGGAPGLVSGLVGYGPESFSFVFPLRDDPLDVEQVAFTQDGRSRFGHALVELGLLGLLATLAVTVLPVILGGLWLRRRADTPAELMLVAGAAVAALAGRAAEQAFAVEHASDAMLAWAVLGLLVAIPRVATPAALADRRPTKLTLAAPAALAAAGVAVLLVSMVATHAVAPVVAARDFSHATDAVERGDADAALDLTLTALDRAPTVALYRVAAVRLLTDTRSTGLLASDEQLITETTVALLSAGVFGSSYSPEMNAQLGVERLVLAQRSGGDIEDAVTTFRRTVDLLPNYWQPKRILGVALFRAGHSEEAVSVLSTALAIMHPRFSGEVLLYRARAYGDLGRLEEARTDLLRARSVTTDQRLLDLIILESDQLSS
jgi:tetratricopeptide (TPR) repeat protein